MVPAGGVDRLLAGTRLRAARVALGRAFVTLTFVRYEDGDLGAYNEVGVLLFVRGPGGTGVYVRHLPVDQEFTLAAGIQIWGYPKSLAEIRIEEGSREASCTVSYEGAEVLELAVRQGGVPFPQPSLPTYTLHDGSLRLTRWTTRGLARVRLGGAKLTLGDHPMAGELRGLGLPRRAVSTSVMPQFRAWFEPAITV
jgi:hypothetical protein